MWLRLFPWATTTGKSSGEGSFSRVEVDSGAEGVVCSNSGKGAANLTQRWKLASLDYSQRRVAGNSGFENHRTAGLWSKTTRIEEIGE